MIQVARPVTSFELKEKGGRKKKKRGRMPQANLEYAVPEDNK